MTFKFVCGKEKTVVFNFLIIPFLFPFVKCFFRFLSKYFVEKEKKIRKIRERN